MARFQRLVRLTPFTANDAAKTSPSRNAGVIALRRPEERFSALPAKQKACEFPVAIAALFSHIGAACGPKAARAGVAQG